MHQHRNPLYLIVAEIKMLFRIGIVLEITGIFILPLQMIKTRKTAPLAAIVTTKVYLILSEPVIWISIVLSPAKSTVLLPICQNYKVSHQSLMSDQVEY